MKLSPQQELLLEMAKKKGYVTLDDASGIWSSPTFQKANIKRFVILGILKHNTIVGRFDYNGINKR